MVGSAWKAFTVHLPISLGLHALTYLRHAIGQSNVVNDHLNVRRENGEGKFAVYHALKQESESQPRLRVDQSAKCDEAKTKFTCAEIAPLYSLLYFRCQQQKMTCIQKRNFFVLKSTRSMKHTLAPASLAYWSNSTEFIYWGKKKIISRGMSRRYCLYIPEVLNSFWHIEREKNKQTKQLVTSAITRIWVLCWQATV